MHCPATGIAPPTAAWRWAGPPTEAVKGTLTEVFRSSRTRGFHTGEWAATTSTVGAVPAWQNADQRVHRRQSLMGR
jgi:hypothetical protein